MSLTTPTRYWNDSCSVEELKYAIERGAVGATSNPVIVLTVLKKEMDLWKNRILQVISDNPTWSEIQVSWKIYEELAVHGAQQMMPVFEREGHRQGRLSIQTDPALYRNPEAILHQAQYFHGLAPNIQIKIPATQSGISIIEEATWQGINLNVTVSFNVPQVLAIGEAVERGLARREAAGKDVSTLSPVATMMVGRNDDWMKIVVKRDGINIDPEYLEWPGVACFKKAYGIYQGRGYRCRLLSAAYRNFYHWTEFIGGDVSLTIPYEWQIKYNGSNVKICPRMQEPVRPEILQALYEKIPDFRRCYDEDGMKVEEFDSFGATVRTLRSFISSWHDFVSLIREFMLPNPDV
jgi:transaldolase